MGDPPPPLMTHHIPAANVNIVEEVGRASQLTLINVSTVSSGSSLSAPTTGYHPSLRIKCTPSRSVSVRSTCSEGVAYLTTYMNDRFLTDRTPYSGKKNSNGFCLLSIKMA